MVVYQQDYNYVDSLAFERFNYLLQIDHVMMCS